MNYNEGIIEVLKKLVEIHINYSKDRKKTKSIKYLIGQTIRQYKIPEENWYVSKEALSLFEKITEKRNIGDYTYQDKITVQQKIEVGIYNGNKKDPSVRTLNKGEKIPYNSVFHDEHTIPVQRFVEDLLYMKKTIDSEKIKKKLDTIYICKILKKEDRKIPNSRKRQGDFKIIVDTIYGNKVSELKRLKDIAN